MMKLDVVVPVYNSSKWLKRCIESILNQTFKEFELILVDDGSLDDSGMVCDEYAKVDKRVKVIHQKNQGVSAARNNGVSAGTSKYVTFIDSDDWIEFDFLQKLMDYIGGGWNSY